MERMVTAAQVINFLEQVFLKPWSLDVFILASLVLQYVLVFTAPLRKNSFMAFFVWLPYVLALANASHAMALIGDKTAKGGRTGQLRLFWAPFLILHLGGPNSITALSLADNEFWSRYALQLYALSYTFSRMFFYSFPNNALWKPTVIIFIVGVVKYLERIFCLFKARLTKFEEAIMPKPDPGVNYAGLMETYTSFQKSDLPVEFEHHRLLPRVDDHTSCSTYTQAAARKLSQVSIVKDAYSFFCEFRGLFVNSVYNEEQRHRSMEYFLARDAEDAFSICEVELNLAYDVFYTKSIFISMIKGPFHNVLSLILQLASLWLWIRIDKQDKFLPNSVIVTYALLGGSIGLEVLSLVTFLASDWFIGMKTCQPLHCCFCERLLLLSKNGRDFFRRMRQVRFFPNIFTTAFCRWSENIRRVDLLSNVFGWRNDDVTPGWITDELRDFIFRELAARSRFAKNPKDVEELCTARGLWTLKILSQQYEALGLNIDTFTPWISDVGFAESLMVWHVATDICYALEDDQEVGYCMLSKIISDHMLYLQIHQSAMMPQLSQTLGLVLFRDTFADAKRFLVRVLPRRRSLLKYRKEQLRQACEKIIEVDTDVFPPREVRGEESKSVLFDACVLAKELRRLKEKEIDMWKVISKVWAEMLFYSATHSTASVHVGFLQTGGELLTLVWLLMTHLGQGKRFRHKKRWDREAELVIGKYS